MENEILKNISYSIEFNFSYYLIHIDKENNTEYLEKNIYKIANEFIKNLKLKNKFYSLDIINIYLIRIRI